MARKKCSQCPKCLPGWLVQFGDLMSLLLTFFILLLSMAVMDKKKVEEYFDIMKKAMGFIDASTDVKIQSKMNSAEDSSSQDDSAQSTDEIIEEIMQEIKDVNDQASNTSEQIQVEKGENEFTLDIPSTIMFKEAEYKLTNPSSKRFIAKIARVIRAIPQTFNIEVIGHTSADDLSNTTIPRDDWDLSILRAVEVVKELIKNKIDPSILKASGYASYHPKSQNPAENRRVEIKFYSENKNNDLLKEEDFFDRLE